MRYVVVEGFIREIWQRAWDPRDFFYIPNLISCPVPTYFQFTNNLTVAITTLRCRTATNVLQVRKFVQDPVKKDGIAVCVKVLLPSNSCAAYANSTPVKLLNIYRQQTVQTATENYCFS